MKQSDSWDATKYSQFLALRTRPAKDLLSAIPDSFTPQIVYDLGCGPGNSTVLLQERWPQARVIGLDNSESMLNEAKKHYPFLVFSYGTIEDFAPPEKIDAFFANASLHCVPHHSSLIPKLLRSLRQGGLFAIQMPNNFHKALHQSIITVLENLSWSHLLAKLNFGSLQQPLFSLTNYYDLLITSGASLLQLWQTEYLQEFIGYQAVFDWVQGTALNAILPLMSPAEKNEFSKSYLEAIAHAYPRQANNKILLPFSRIFMVGFL